MIFSRRKCLLFQLVNLGSALHFLYFIKKSSKSDVACKFMTKHFGIIPPFLAELVFYIINHQKYDHIYGNLIFSHLLLGFVKSGEEMSRRSGKMQFKNNSFSSLRDRETGISIHPCCKDNAESSLWIWYFNPKNLHKEGHFCSL